MLAVILCLAGVFGLLVIAEILWHYKILKGEDQRKFTHISVGTFAAFWPWLISWHSIQLIAVAMTIVVLINRPYQWFHIRGIKKKERETYGDLLVAPAILLITLLTTTKIFFTLAILHMSLADGLAAVVGTRYGLNWRYKVYHQVKTVVGSMAFWFVSICILAPGLLYAHDLIDYNHYLIVLLALPPVLTIVENVAGMGLDNIFVPLAVIMALQIAQTA
jgi:dolichol kinase